jgi:hypothetical protein
MQQEQQQKQHRHLATNTPLASLPPLNKQSYEFHELPIDDFTAVFDRHALGVGSELARTFEVPGQDTAPRAALGAMLDELLGRRARKAELQARWVGACCGLRARMLIPGRQSHPPVWQVDTLTCQHQQFWFTFLDFDSNCLITRREWDAAIAALREASASPQQVGAGRRNSSPRSRGAGAARVPRNTR